MAKISGLEFEDVCATVLKDRGFKKVNVTKGSGDQGVDILAWKNDKQYAVQCKLYSRPVGNKAVQEVFAGMNYYECDAAIVMTNSTFTKSAIALAESTGVELWEEMPIKPVVRYPFIMALLSIVAVVVSWFILKDKNIKLFIGFATALAVINVIWYFVVSPVKKWVENLKNRSEDDESDEEDYRIDKKSIVYEFEEKPDLFFELIKWSDGQIRNYIEEEEEYASAEDAKFFIMAKDIVSKRRVFYRAVYNEGSEAIDIYYYSKDGVNEIVTCVSIEVTNILPEDYELYIAKDGKVISYIQSFEELCDELSGETIICKPTEEIEEEK
ncbi:MAG: restriction endonuclease [Lachnospiraceae bacterium]|nr:restriction endonuclease [Lachnospiraceae bacterium]